MGWRPGSEELARKPDTAEPANSCGCVSVFWEEIVYNHSVVGVIDFIPGAGHLDEACLAGKILCAGVAQAVGPHVQARHHAR